MLLVVRCLVLTRLCSVFDVVVVWFDCCLVACFFCGLTVSVLFLLEDGVFVDCCLFVFGYLFVLFCICR